MDILSWKIAEVVSPCLPRSLWSHIVIIVFLLLGTVCPRHPPYPVLPFCPLLRAFPYPGDTGGRRSALAICQSLTSADHTAVAVQIICTLYICHPNMYCFIKTQHLWSADLNRLSFSVLAKRFAGKSIPKMTCFVSSGTLSINSINYTQVVLEKRPLSECCFDCVVLLARHSISIASVALMLRTCQSLCVCFLAGRSVGRSVQKVYCRKMTA